MFDDVVQYSEKGEDAFYFQNLLRHPIIREKAQVSNIGCMSGGNWVVLEEAWLVTMSHVSLART